MKRWLVGAAAVLATFLFISGVVALVVWAVVVRDDGTPADRTFSQELLLGVYDNFFTPLFTALFVAGAATLAVWLVQGSAQARRDARQLAQRCNRRAVQIAGAFYGETQRYWRKFDKPVDWGALSDDDKKGFDVAYAKFSLDADVFEQELASWYGWDSNVRLTWHQIWDLLTVRYFDVRNRPKRATDGLVDANSKGHEDKYHSGLTAAELRDPKTLLDAYRKSLRRLHADLERPHPADEVKMSETLSGAR
jgi:hypothetical protein